MASQTPKPVDSAPSTNHSTRTPSSDAAWGATGAGVLRAGVVDVAAAGAATRIVPTLGTNEAAEDIAAAVDALNAEYPALTAIAWFTHGGWSNEGMAEATARLEGWR